MAFPIAAVAGRGLLEVGKYLAAAGIPGIGFGLLAQPKEYEQNFDHDYYNINHERFYSPIYATEDNPLGFNQELYDEAMVEYYDTKPMY